MTAAGIVHPGPTVGYRIEAGGAAIAYLPDHEPVLGGAVTTKEWLSGYDLARNVDTLIHDGQFTDDEYRQRVGWGHSSVSHAVQVADLVEAPDLVLIHHDPDHSDDFIDGLVASASRMRSMGTVRAASEGMLLKF